LDVPDLLARARLMIGSSEAAVPPSANPGVRLGVILGELAKAGRDKLTFVTSSGISALGGWLEQLIAESTGKHGQGILPVVAEPLGNVADYGHDRVFVSLGQQNGPSAELLAAVRAAGHPVIELSWEDDYALGTHYFLWEFATAVAGHVLGIQPFDQPDVESAKVQGRAFVDEYTRTGALPASDQQPLNAAEVHAALAAAQPGDYVALQAYAAPSDELTTVLQRLRAYILRTQQVASTLGYGPRFLHSTGQLHKGDRGGGIFLQFVTPSPADDSPIPDAAGSSDSTLSFGVLKTAQAMGDAAALRAAGRRVASFSAPADLAAALRSILQELEA